MTSEEVLHGRVELLSWQWLALQTCDLIEHDAYRLVCVYRSHVDPAHVRSLTPEKCIWSVRQIPFVTDFDKYSVLQDGRSHPHSIDIRCCQVGSSENTLHVISGKRAFSYLH